MDERELFEQRIDGRTVYEGRIFRVESDTALLSNGAKVPREVLRHSGGVCVAAYDGENVLLVRQFRYPYGRVLWELPAGKLAAGENPDEAALRELSEETGCEPQRLVKLAESYPSPGYTDEVLHLYIALELRFLAQHLDENELLRVEKIPLRRAVEMVLSGEIRDGKTQTLLLLCEKYLNGEMEI